MFENEVEIFYAEDNPTDVELTLVALRRNRLANSVHIARDGAEALDFLFCRGAFAGRDFSAPRVVLLDLKLPKVDGIEVLQAIRQDKRTKLIPVVVMTSSKEQKDVESYKLHVNSYIQKPDGLRPVSTSRRATRVVLASGKPAASTRELSQSAQRGVETELAKTLPFYGGMQRSQY